MADWATGSFIQIKTILIPKLCWRNIVDLRDQLFDTKYANPSVQHKQYFMWGFTSQSSH